MEINQKIKSSFSEDITISYLENLIEESDLDIALNDLEEKMDEKSFENFMRIKKESISKNKNEEKR